jgi:N-glycosylase/DNA lyase
MGDVVAGSGMKTPRPDVPQVSLSLFGHGIDLDATLTSGQCFSWRRSADGRWRGWIQRRPCLVWTQGDALRAVGPSLTHEAVTRYFGLDVPMREVFSSFPSDTWLERARAFAPGLRILRQEPWETLCNFICSSLKQIVQIERINHDLRQAFGRRVGDSLYTFPDASRLALAPEARLRECRLGFRARHLFFAARQVAGSEVSLDRVAALPTPEAREELMRIRGVGEKVANCILLFAYDRPEAFPIDVWVERVLRRLYFPDRPRVTSERMRRFAENHFGPYRGYAQQFLFHWIRKDPRAASEWKTEAPGRTATARARKAKTEASRK